MQHDLKQSIEKLLTEFSNMLNDWESGRHVTKICYGLNNEHMKAIQNLKAIMDKDI